MAEIRHITTENKTENKQRRQISQIRLSSFGIHRIELIHHSKNNSLIQHIFTPFTAFTFLRQPSCSSGIQGETPQEGK
ncbi:hypothetical protein GPL06_02535 [Bacteroides salyersiae]|uniref:hypothetical protein n=1 Tax=Bacteroides salyersiae TaxID=291644 RepID=UPI001B8BD75E|nr:hypothetical protein [Bacteroides salyersiae]MBT9871717.1 hypothetical protein [Bacteroides salyersiae]